PTQERADVGAAMATAAPALPAPARYPTRPTPSTNGATVPRSAALTSVNSVASARHSAHLSRCASTCVVSRLDRPPRVHEPNLSAVARQRSAGLRSTCAWTYAF